MFTQILDISQTFVSSLYDFASSILDFLSAEFTVGETTYTLFAILFTSAITLIITYGIIKFITDIVT